MGDSFSREDPRVGDSTAEATPLLRLPSADAPPDEWASVIPITDLPPLPSRGEGYWYEPICGVLLVGVLCVMLVTVTTGIATTNLQDKALAGLLVVAISTWAAIAVGSVMFILFAGAGDIKRSRQTCYPIPEEVAKRLVAKKSLDGMRNIDGSVSGTSYCVRCCVWRTGRSSVNCSTGDSHHCNTCQRCVKAFDHHCGVFGRCIVGGNMPCFIALISMLFTGMLTAGVAVVGASDNTDSYSYRAPQEVYPPSPLAAPTTLAPTLAPLIGGTRLLFA